MSTSYGVKPYRCDSKDKREKIGLALSGGGFRASLFHLGGLRRLNELGLLTRIDTLTSVSGGSVTAAQLARHRLEHPEPWREHRRIESFEEEIAEPLREFSRHDIRTRAVFSRFFPWNWFRHGVAVEALAQRLTHGPPGRVNDGPAGAHALSELDDKPSFVLCATELHFRTQWRFDTGEGRIGDELVGFSKISSYWTLARAAAASACFPPAFEAMRVPEEPRPPGTYTGTDRDSLVRGLELTDGGLFDNMGLEPIWRGHAAVLVSDASPTFKYAPSVFGLAWGALRYAITLLEQATDVRKRWLISRFLRGDLEGAYWGIGSLPTNYGGEHTLPVYSDRFITDLIAQIRIDFDAFSEGEIAVLENHGYILAEIGMRKHAARLVHVEWPAPHVPHPEWMDERKAEQALRESAKTKLFARFR